MWTDTTRAQHARDGLALPSDMTDAEWLVPEGFFPPPSRVRRPDRQQWMPMVSATIPVGITIAAAERGLSAWRAYAESEDSLADTAESAFLHGPQARKRPGSFSPSKPLIVGHISGHGKKFAVAVMGEVREVREVCPQRS
jgi:hypothetical protein